jgi:dTDP-4-amino-4,6-dideoxygalactose transaminase
MQSMGNLRRFGTATQLFYDYGFSRVWYYATFAIIARKYSVTERFYAKAFSLPLSQATFDADVDSIVVAVKQVAT